MNGLRINFVTSAGAFAKIMYPCNPGEVMLKYFKTVKLIRKMYLEFKVVAVVDGAEVDFTAQNWRMS